MINPLEKALQVSHRREGLSVELELIDQNTLNSVKI